MKLGNRYLLLLGLFSTQCMTDAANERRLSHWAWQPLQEGLRDAGRSIDSFVERKLQEKGLQFSKPADRRTLIRRLTHDLHGLPPTPEAVDAFLADKNPKAYEKRVDHLLNHPRFGERMAQHWLDIAHYADTHGFERDKRRPHAWPYRDYVIRSFNEDKPYLKFLQEQIAGDALWPDDPDAVIATGFLAAGPWDFVGQVETRSGVLRRSARALDLDDMATQVFTSTLAVTLNCARCHDHKLDPITQEEYYRITAVFAGVKRADRNVSEARKNKLVAERLETLREINRITPGMDLADIVGGGDGHGSGTIKDGIDPRSGKVERKSMGFLTDVKANHFSPSPNPFVDGVFIPQTGKEKPEVCITSTGLTIAAPPGSDGKAWDIIRNGPVTRTHSTALGGVDFTQDGNTLLGLHANAGITFDLDAFRKAMGRENLRVTAQVGYFGARADNSYADARIYLDGRKSVEFLKLKRADNLRDVDLPLPPTVRFLTLLSTAAGNGIGMDQVGFGNPKLKTPATELPQDQRKRLAELQRRKTTLDKEIAALGVNKVYSVVPETKMPEVRILDRGNPEAPLGDPLAPGTLHMLQTLRADLGTGDSPETQRRTTLAQWITHENNPLAHRVIVNRLWQWTFGTGIVSTPSDFGYGGDRPSHPELLDWLAHQLKENNGSLKALLREILLSRTYRQQSAFDENHPGVTADTANRLFWRQNARRMDAETVRDSVLLVSGKLNDERGGPGFEDFAYKEAYAPEYNYLTADSTKLWRRSIYRFVVRTTPNTFMSTLDCPDPANFTPKRLNTTTPLQSLALYNNDFMLRQARHLAERIEKSAGAATKHQVELAFRLAFNRSPNPEESQLSQSVLEKDGLFVLCRALLNANEFVYFD